MDKKELILTVAKEIFLESKINISDIEPVKRIESVGKFFALMVKEIEKVYEKINDQ